jgi:hypothetical protein
LELGVELFVAVGVMAEARRRRSGMCNELLGDETDAIAAHDRVEDELKTVAAQRTTRGDGLPTARSKQLPFAAARSAAIEHRIVTREIGDGARLAPASLELYLAWTYRSAFAPMLQARVAPAAAPVEDSSQMRR